MISGFFFRIHGLKTGHPTAKLKLKTWLVGISDFKNNKTGIDQFHDCCKNWALNPGLMFHIVKSWQKLFDNFKLDRYIIELNYENDNT